MSRIGISPRNGTESTPSTSFRERTFVSLTANSHKTPAGIAHPSTMEANRIIIDFGATGALLPAAVDDTCVAFRHPLRQLVLLTLVQQVEIQFLFDLLAAFHRKDLLLLGRHSEIRRLVCSSCARIFLILMFSPTIRLSTERMMVCFIAISELFKSCTTGSCYCCC